MRGSLTTTTVRSGGHVATSGAHAHSQQRCSRWRWIRPTASEGHPRGDGSPQAQLSTLRLSDTPRTAPVGLKPEHSSGNMRGGHSSVRQACSRWQWIRPTGTQNGEVASASLLQVAVQPTTCPHQPSSKWHSHSPPLASLPPPIAPARPMRQPSSGIVGGALAHASAPSSLQHPAMHPSPVEFHQTVKVKFHQRNAPEVTVHPVWISQYSTAHTVLEALRPQVNMSKPDEELRLLKVFVDRVEVLSRDDLLGDLDERIVYLAAEEVPGAEKHVAPGERLVQVYRLFKNEQGLVSYDQLYLILEGGESLQDVIDTLQEEDTVQRSQPEKWSFTLVTPTSIALLQADDILSEKLQCIISRAWREYLVWQETDGMASEKRRREDVPSCDLAEAPSKRRNIEAEAANDQGGFGSPFHP